MGKTNNKVVVTANGETYEIDSPKYGELIINFQDYVPQVGKNTRSIDFKKDFDKNNRLAE